VVQQGGEIRRHRCQFSWWCDGRSDTPRNRRDWQRSSELALAIYWGQTDDPTEGALWYHADYVSPAWRNDFVQGRTIGRHIFYQAKLGQGYQVASQTSGN
jgi:spore germination cell wall hydrolase CwlJ-like protein